MANNLFDLAQAYLNQGMPDISGIFPPPPATIGPITKLPIEPEQEEVVKLGGNEEGFSVYNPDPNMTRTSRNYVNPFPFDPMDNFGTPDYGYIEEPRKGIQGLFDQYVKTSIPAQLLGKGIKGLINQLPISRAGIFQNELLGGGFMLDNTGRIVSNNYNTPQGIMAGYNPVSGGAINKLTGGRYGDEPTYGLDKSYDKRRETVSKALKDMGMSDEDIKAAVAGEYTGDIPINPITGKPTALVDRLNLFNQSQKLLNERLRQADVVYDRKLEKRRESDSKFQKQKAIEDAAKAKRNIQKYTSGGGGGGGCGGGIGSSYGGAASPGSKGPGGSDEMGSF